MDDSFYNILLMITITVFLATLEPSTQAENQVPRNKVLLHVLKKRLRWDWVILITDGEYDEEIYFDLHGSNIATVLYKIENNDVIPPLSHIENITELRVLIACKWIITSVIIKQIVDSAILWRSKNRFLIVVEEDKVDTAAELLIHDDNVILLTIMKDQVKMHTLCKDRKGCCVESSIMEHSPLETDLKVSDKLLLQSRHGNHSSLEARVIKVALEQHSPFFKPANGPEASNSGLDIMILETLGKKLNFTYKIYRPKDHSWGTNDNGMIGMVKHHEVDIAMAGMTMTYERSNVVDFSFPYVFERTTFVTRAPSERNKMWAIFFPFTWEAWVCISLTMVLVGIILAAVENKTVPLRMKRSDNVKLSLYDSLLYIYQALLSQGGYDSHWTRTRILISFWFLFVIVVSTGYTGNLMSFLTNPGQVDSIDTISKLVDALKSGRYSCGTIRTSSDYEIFQKSTGEFHKIILKSMDSDPTNFVHHDKEGLAKCLSENYAYIAGQVTVEADIEVESAFLFAKDTFQTSGYAIAMTKGFLFRESFDRIVLWLGQAGLLEKWLKDLIASGRKPPKIKEGSPSALTLPELQGAFSLMLLGCGLATVVLLLERSYERWRKDAKTN